MTRKLTKVTEVFLRQHGTLVLCLHISLILLSLFLSWLLRFEFTIKNEAVVLNAAPILVLFRIAAMYRYNLLHGHWRYTGVHDAGDILKATLLGSVGFFLVVRVVLGVHSFPPSVYVIECLLTGCFVAAVRIGFRVLAEASMRLSSGNDKKKVLIIGAGFAAQMIIRELHGTPSGYSVVGCLDDDPKKLGLRVLGQPVLGNVDKLSEIASQYGVDEVLIAVPSATGAEMRRFVSVCQTSGLKFFTVPSLHDLMSGSANIRDLREVDLDDLLGRDPVKIDLKSVNGEIEGKVVMVTGAAGSIGSELCRQILRYNPSKLICFDHNETGLFYLDIELGTDKAAYCVGNYTHSEQMRRTLSTHGVQLIFHAAAYKHVPLMEANARVAVQNNVHGLEQFLEVADAANCEAFILISSDKAVNPSNIMGATKRIGELMLSSRPFSGMRCVSVRFGNVLGSRGSVVPVFQKQLIESKRITVTHPDITRYFMTIREAVSLVLQASAVGKHGDILVLDMGDPIRIVDLARTLIRLSGKTEKEVAIVFTGLRPGEKLYEELFYSSEDVHPTSCDKIKRTQGKILGWKDLKARLAALLQMSNRSDYEIRKMVQDIVPEYQFQVQADAMATAAESPSVWQLPELPSYAEATGDD